MRFPCWSVLNAPAGGAQHDTRKRASFGRAAPFIWACFWQSAVAAAALLGFSGVWLRQVAGLWRLWFLRENRASLRGGGRVYMAARGLLYEAWLQAKRVPVAASSQVFSWLRLNCMTMTWLCSNLDLFVSVTGRHAACCRPDGGRSSSALFDNLCCSTRPPCTAST